MQDNQLRIIFVCPNCRFGVKIDPTRRFICRCGYDTMASTSTPINTNMEIANKRIAICAICEHHNNYRCVNVELGCRPAFMDLIQNGKASCPLNKWGPIVQETPEKPENGV